MTNFTWVWLLLLELLMASTHTGSVPVPGPGMAITMLHVPVILAAVLSGPLQAGLVGLVFGASSWLEFPPNGWVVLVVPRVLMGVFAGLAFRWAKRTYSPSSRISMGALLAAMVGSLTNTLGVTFLSALQGNPPMELALVIAMHGVPELVLAVVVTVPTAIAVYHRDRR